MRLERLVRAGIRISGQQALERVLGEVADSAREVIGARYAALGVLDPACSALTEFVTSGVAPDVHAAIGHLPTGKGILGLLISDPKPLRLRRLADHPQSSGFPPHHPPMESFLGVPIVGRAGPIGNLYLAEKIGADEFSDEDEAVAVLLAAQAAVAVENARLYNDLKIAQASRDRFFAMINHELRNALTAVYGWSQLLVRKEGENAPRAAQEVLESSERTLGLLNDLLDLSRLEASKLNAVLRAADARALVNEAVTMVEPAAHARDITIERIGLNGVLACETDTQRVRQILVNLLSNAIRHSPAGSPVTLTVEVSESQMAFAIRDRGEGIAREHLTHIFEAFARAGSSDERGTGLGLTLSRQLALLLGGNLSVDSELGKGATFTLDLPRWPAANVKKPS